MLKEEKIRVFTDSEGMTVKFAQRRFGNGDVLIYMGIYVHGWCFAIKYFDSKKQAFKMMGTCEKAKHGLLQEIFNKFYLKAN